MVSKEELVLTSEEEEEGKKEGYFADFIYDEVVYGEQIHTLNPKDHLGMDWCV